MILCAVRTSPAVWSNQRWAIRALLAGAHQLKLVERLSHELAKAALDVSVSDPAFESDPQHGSSQFGGKSRGRIADAAPAKAIGERRGECCQLDAFTLLQLRIFGYDGLPPPREIAARFKEARRRFHSDCHGVDWGQRSRCVV